MDDEAILFYDGTCKLCSRSVNFVLRHEKQAVLHFASLDSDCAQQHLPAEGLPDSLVLLHKGKLYIESDAAFLLASYLKLPYRLLRLFRIFPNFLANPVYRIIARNRYRWFGRETGSCIVPTEGQRGRFL